MHATVPGSLSAGYAQVEVENYSTRVADDSTRQVADNSRGVEHSRSAIATNNVVGETIIGDSRNSPASNYSRPEHAGSTETNTTTKQANNSSPPPPPPLNCTKMPPHNFTGKPLWIPAYPGSGSEMLRALVKATTGIGGEDVYDNQCKIGPATCKTHWPTISNRKGREPARDKARFADRYIVLLRNPKNALPSFFNYKWELKNRIKAHSKQAPKEDWVLWRDNNFEAEIENWKNLFIRWREQPYERAFYLQYEALTSVETGPQLFGKVAAEMRRNGVQVAPEADISCLWYSVVNGKKVGTKRAPHKYKPGYSADQQAGFLRMLEELKQAFLDDPEIVHMLDGYYYDIRDNILIDANSTTANGTSATLSVT
jgi:hypothetical protein